MRATRLQASTRTNPVSRTDSKRRTSILSFSAPFALLFWGCASAPNGNEHLPQQADASGYTVELHAPGRTGPLGEAVVNTRFGPVIVTYEQIDGLAILEGDIVLGSVEELRSSEKNVGLWADASNWIDRVIPYQIDVDLSATMVGRIEDAMQAWTEDFGFNFVDRTSETQYVNFQPGTGCSSGIGKQSGATNVSLATGCSTGNVIHEIGHAVGLHHTHVRCDRNLHVMVFEERIDPDFLHNFTKQCGTSYWDVAWWDSQSIMHYDSWAFQAEGETDPTMTLADGVTTFSSQRTALTDGDLQAVRELYDYSMPAAWFSTFL
jgi:hypothetical protein